MTGVQTCALPISTLAANRRKNYGTEEKTSPDVRAGMALVIAAACWEGESEIQNIYQIERGYENFENKLGSIGIGIKKV